MHDSVRHTSIRSHEDVCSMHGEISVEVGACQWSASVRMDLRSWAKERDIKYEKNKDCMQQAAIWGSQIAQYRV